jgi:hypothetical protein
MKFRALAILVFLAASLSAQDRCAVNFAPATLKPSVFQSILTVISSLNPKGEAQRLTDLKQIVFQLEQKKAELAETLDKVSQQNSVPSWLEASVHQIRFDEIRLRLPRPSTFTARLLHDRIDHR